MSGYARPGVFPFQFRLIPVCCLVYIPRRLQLCTSRVCNETPPFAPSPGKPPAVYALLELRIPHPIERTRPSDDRARAAGSAQSLLITSELSLQPQIISVALPACSPQLLGIALEGTCQRGAPGTSPTFAVVLPRFSRSCAHIDSRILPSFRYSPVSLLIRP